MANDDSSVRDWYLLVDQVVVVPHHRFPVLEGGGARLGRRAFLRRVIPSMVGSGHGPNGLKQFVGFAKWVGAMPYNELAPGRVRA